jgi:hypothetical protein
MTWQTTWERIYDRYSLAYLVRRFMPRWLRIRRYRIVAQKDPLVAWEFGVLCAYFYHRTGGLSFATLSDFNAEAPLLARNFFSETPGVCFKARLDPARIFYEMHPILVGIDPELVECVLSRPEIRIELRRMPHGEQFLRLIQKFLRTPEVRELFG